MNWVIDLERRIARHADFWVTWDDNRWDDGFTLSAYNASDRRPECNALLLDKAEREIDRVRTEVRPSRKRRL